MRDHRQSLHSFRYSKDLGQGEGSLHSRIVRVMARPEKVQKSVLARSVRIGRRVKSDPNIALKLRQFNANIGTRTIPEQHRICMTRAILIREYLTMPTLDSGNCGKAPILGRTVCPLPPWTVGSRNKISNYEEILNKHFGWFGLTDQHRATDSRVSDGDTVLQESIGGKKPADLP